MSLGVFVQLNEDSMFAHLHLLGYVIQENGCWDWVGSTSRGYGYMAVGGKLKLVTRHLYERDKGPIPKGLCLDHLCKRPICVNPDHLQPVTWRENLMRGDTWTSRNAAKTHCDHGHEYTPENTYRDRTGWRRCRECTRQKNKAAYHIRKRRAQ